MGPMGPIRQAQGEPKRAGWLGACATDASKFWVLSSAFWVADSEPPIRFAFAPLRGSSRLTFLSQFRVFRVFRGEPSLFVRIWIGSAWSRGSLTGGIDNRRFSLLSSPFHMSILIWILTFVLLLVSVFLILVVLAQKSKDGGMGAALGGGMTESAFGAETGNVLFSATRNATIAFFILAFGLYLCHIYQRKHTGSAGDGLPNIPVPAAVSSLPAEKGATPTAGTNTAAAPLVSLPAAPAPATATPAAAPSAPEPKKQ